MAFQRDGSNNVIAFAESEDVKNLDQRLFEANEFTFEDSGTGATTLEDYIDVLCERATDRITTKMQASPEWNSYVGAMNISQTGILPPVNKNLIRDNLQDWTDMCVAYVLKEYLLPKVADFGNPESSEVQKINFYNSKFDELFREKLSLIVWYDVDNDSTVEGGEQLVNFRKNRRTRGKRFITRVR